MDSSSSTNYLQLIFIWIAILTFLPGLLTNYAHKYLPSAFLQFFRYGRANVLDSGKSLGFLKNIEVPKKWFYHCYIYAICLQSLIIYTVISTYGYGSQLPWLKYTLEIIGGNNREQTIDTSTTVLAVLIFLFQVSRRLYETCFVCVYSNTKMNVVHYLLTWIHYTGSMLTIVAYSPVFASHTIINDLSVSWTDISFIQYIAIVLFFYGSWIQFQAHVGLASLRKGKGDIIVTMKHQIPRGGLFEKISCPNYWGEIIVYSAMALLFNFQNYTWNYIALWVIANQVIVGIMNHQWYQATFPDYPKHRKAVIPYLW